ncbi:MAG: acyl-CoA synthetase [Spirosomataceae bacterium]
MLQLIQNAFAHTSSTAVVSNGKSFTYDQLLEDSLSWANQLLNDSDDLQEERIAFMVSPGYAYVALQWGIWRAGGVAVPLCVKHPIDSIRYTIEDTQASVVVYAPEFEELLRPLMGQKSIRFIQTGNSAQVISGDLPEFSAGRRAMILYTSGTTGKPKGVVTTHANIETQVETLVTAWEWQATDHILNVLPLHHVHGIINALTCALWSGACCEFLEKFSEEAILDKFQLGEVNIFMAVPTIYYKLINQYAILPEAQQEQISAQLVKFRLMVSGSAALPVSTLEKWKIISNHTLLERYGMTEIGMAVSNPYVGERRPGHIGQALPGVEIRLVDEHNLPVTTAQAGEIQVKGANVFKEYWQKPEATAGTFTDDGWFKTGDIATVVDGYYRILGRNSVDIIKSGGYKISALEIEEVLRTYPQINECAVVGLADEEWGELIAACLILFDDSSDIDLKALTKWLKEKVPSYKIPRRYLIIEELPRNVMGKVTKQEVKGLFA